MKKILNWILPKERKLFEMLEGQSENAMEAAKELKNFIGNYSDVGRSERKSRCLLIKTIERKGDEITHEIITKLDKSSRNQIGRDDLRQMAVLLDDVLDLINAVASRFVVLGIERIDNYTIKLIEILFGAVENVSKIVSNLKKFKDIGEDYSKVCRLEGEADELYQEALSELFHFYKNSVDIIKYKEIYDLLERAIDKCKKVGNAAESMSIRHS